ncbi:helix-turn-helix transcriptional regulator [Streptomyces erythrochromogenes]|uniref:helix-turn-helix transcriptional regulator n=1 Tax=Streptomyces erythrochromogenes TaxID=285574 RepID=UPI0036CAB2B0
MSKITHVTLYKKTPHHTSQNRRKTTKGVEVLVLRTPGMPVRRLVRRRGNAPQGAPGREARRTAGTVPKQRCGYEAPTAEHEPHGRSGAATQVDEREREILTYVANGFSTKQIARRVAYSDRMIKYVLNGFVRKFQLCNRTHAVAFAIREGIIP